VIAQVNADQGEKIREVETQILRWLRLELLLLPFLGKEEMGTMGGWKETFSGDGISDQAVIDRISEELRTVGLSERLLEIHQEY
jgi:hypothetical protein